MTNEDTGFTRTVTTDSAGEYTVPQVPTGNYTVLAELDGFKATALSNIDVGVDQRVRIDVRLEVGQMTESVTIEATTPLVQTNSSELGTTVDEEQIKTLPLNGRNFVSLTRTVPGRAPRHPRREHRRRRQPRLARVGVVLGQRPARARQQLHARRRRQQRDLAADGRPLPERRLARRVQAADQHLLGRVRPLPRRRRQPADQVGNEQVARQRLRVPAQRRASTRTTSSTTAPAATSPTSASTSSAGHSAARSSRTGRSSSLTIRAIARSRGRRSSRTCRRCRCAQGDFSELTRVIYDPTTGQPFAGNVIPLTARIDASSATSSMQLYPEPNTAGTRKADRPDDQQLPDQPDQGAAGQPVRREGRSQPVDGNRFFGATATRRRIACSRPRCRTATPARPSARATATSRHRAWRSTTRISSARNWLNEARFGWTSIKFYMTLDRLRREPRDGGGHSRHQLRPRRRR